MTEIKTKRNNAYIRRLHNSDTRKDDATHSMAVTACKSYMGRIYDRNSLLGQDIQTAFVLFLQFLMMKEVTGLVTAKVTMTDFCKNILQFLWDCVIMSWSKKNYLLILLTFPLTI